MYLKSFGHNAPIANIAKRCLACHVINAKSSTLATGGLAGDSNLHFDYERASILGNTCWHPIVGQQCASKFIPVTRQVLVQKILEDQDLVKHQYKDQLAAFAVHFDSTLTGHYRVILKKLKSLYNPLSPERDTVQMKFFTRDQLLHREKMVVAIMDQLLEEGHFYRLPEVAVDKALDEQNVGEGVTVKVSRRNYATLIFWVIGMDVAPVDDRPWYVVAGERAKKRREGKHSLPDPLEFEEHRKYSFLTEVLSGMWTKLYGKQIPRVERYKRVVVAVRQKKEFKLFLKGFKDVPCENLEFLLPGGKIKMKLLDKIRFGLMGTFLMAVIVSATVTKMADFRFGTDFIVVCVLLLVFFRNWMCYNNMKKRYLVNMSQTLYFKSVANNHAMLPLVTDRAVDEAFKAGLLICSMLLPRNPTSDDSSPSMSYAELKLAIEEWVRERLGVDIDFHPSSALQLLTKWSILKETRIGDSIRYSLNNLDDVIRYLTYSKGISLESTGDELGLFSRSGGSDQQETEGNVDDRFYWK